MDSHVCRLVEFALGGLSNLVSVSQTNRIHFINHKNLICIVACLFSPISTVVIYSLSILIHIFSSSDKGNSFPSLNSEYPSVMRIARLYLSRSNNKILDPRIRILSQILLEDCCEGVTI